jgi:hypothetical protein
MVLRTARDEQAERTRVHVDTDLPMGGPLLAVELSSERCASFRIEDLELHRRPVERLRVREADFLEHLLVEPDALEIDECFRGRSRPTRFISDSAWPRCSSVLPLCAAGLPTRR